MTDLLEGESEPLTPAELRVFEQLVKGGSNQAIADELFLSEATVRTHLTHIYGKLGVRSRAELLATISRDGMDGGPPHPPATDSAATEDPGAAGILAVVGVMSAVFGVGMPLAALVTGPITLATTYALRHRVVGHVAWVRSATLGLGVVLTVFGLLAWVPMLLLMTASASVP